MHLLPSNSLAMATSAQELLHSSAAFAEDDERLPLISIGSTYVVLRLAPRRFRGKRVVIN